MAVGRLTTGRRRRRAGCHRLAAVALLRGWSVGGGRRENVTPGGHEHGGRLSSALARREWRLGSLLRRGWLVVVLVVLVLGVV